MAPLLLASVFVVATCGLVYELVAGALTSYLLGDSITAFSTIIGTYLFAMGVGSYLSKFVTRNHLLLFIQVEILIGFVGGMSAALLFLAFAHTASFQVSLYLLVFIIGVLVGLEIPLLMHILYSTMSFRDVVARVLSFDYVGALIGSVAFPLILLPHLGLIRTALLFGIFNVLVAVLALFTLARREPWSRSLQYVSAFVVAALLAAFVFGDTILNYAEAAVYPDRVLYTSTTPYQRIVLTHGGDSVKLYLNGHLQFDSRDEYRYHEALIHVGARMPDHLKDVLVLGGGDGLAVRELLKYPSIESITLVDLDPAMTTLFRKSPLLSALNKGSLSSPKLSVVNADALVWLRTPPHPFDFIVVDFPDPTNYGLGKLYTRSFYKLLARALAPSGIIVVQSTSPMMARQSYWCINQTLEAAGFITKPYHTYVPSFGEWGFILAEKGERKEERPLPAGLRFITPEVMPALFFFPKDMERVETEVNRLNNQSLVRSYEKEWARYGL